MKIQKTIIFFAGTVLIGGAACSKPQMETVNSNAAPQNSNSTTMAAHSSEKSFPPGAMPTPVPRSDTKTKWTQSGNPIETAKFDADIAKAEKDLKAKPADDAAKKALAEKYVERGQALTDARQYASALGDYRKALKLDPDNADAKKWVDQIIQIYDSINREYPPEGEEPPALPFNKNGKTETNKSF